MKEIKELCKFSHDYDGFMYVEENCSCVLCKKGKQYVLEQTLLEDRDYEPAGGEHNQVVLEGENLDKTLKDLCISEWGKTYGINDKNITTMEEYIKNAETK